MRYVTTSFVAALLAFGIACAGPAGSGGERPGVLTSQEIREVEAQYSDMHSVIQALEPSWLHSRGATSVNVEDTSEPVVFLDGNRRGGLEVLRQISPSNIEEAEFLSAREATT